MDAQVRQFPLRLPANTYETLRAEASAKGCSVNALVNTILEDHLATNRTELIELIANRSRERYATVLDKLKDL